MRQPVIKPCVNDQVPAHRMGNGPKISHGIPAEERLREMPDFTGYGEPSERMGNGKSLPELRSMHCTRDLLGKNSIRIDVEAVEVVAQKNRA
jgi:hypothetical protein